MRLDGREVEPFGSLLDTILAAGIPLPHLCKDDALPVIGACRTCLVEADGRVVAACSTPATGVSECLTHTGRVTRIRRGVLELTRAMQSGPPSQTGGPCSAETAAALAAHGIEQARYLPRNAAYSDSSNTFFSFHQDACILCGRCTAACQDLQHIGAIGIAGRGLGARITAGTGGPLSASICTSCGSCVAACPTTALSPKE